MSCDFQPISLIPAALQTQKFQVTRIKISPSGRPQPDSRIDNLGYSPAPIRPYKQQSRWRAPPVYVGAVIEPQQLLTVQVEIPAP